MANTLFMPGLQRISNKLSGWDSGTVIRCLLVANSSTYIPDTSDATIKDMKDSGLVELSASGYSRATVNNKSTIAAYDTPDAIEWHADQLVFGDIEAGRTIKALVFYIRVGTTDNDNVDIPLAYVDTASGLPLITGGGTVIVREPQTGFFRMLQG